MKEASVKLVTFEVRTALGSQSRVGCLLSEDGAAVWDINACTAYQLEAGGWSHPWERADLDAPPSMIEFLATGPAGIAGAQATVAAPAESGIHDHHRRRLLYEMTGVRLLAPVPRPPSVRDFLMVREHVENAFARLPPDKRPPHSIEDMAHTLRDTGRATRTTSSGQTTPCPIRPSPMSSITSSSWPW